jgi:hypothetical protein
MLAAIPALPTKSSWSGTLLSTGTLLLYSIRPAILIGKCKGKVVPVLSIRPRRRIYLIKHHAMKMYWRMEVKLHAFLTSPLDEDEWSS